MGERFESLDGMRGVCALIVLILHCDIALNTGHLISHGWLCVDAFFVLSGFVLAHRYEADLGKQGGLQRYFRGRFRRLVPTMELGYLFSVFCLLFVYLRGLGLWRRVPLADFAAAFGFGALWIPLRLTPIKSYPAFGGEDYPLDLPLWSLFGEAVANIVYGLLLYAVRIRILAIIVVVLWLILLGMALHSPTGWGGTELVRGVGRAISGFLAGVILFRSFKAGHLNALPSVNPVLIFSIWFSVCCVPYKASMIWFSAVVATIGVPLAMAFLVRTERSTPKLFRWLGYISYPLYVSHFGFVWIAIAFLPHNVERHNILWAIPMVALSLCVAWAIAKLTEMRRKDRAVLAPVATGSVG